MASWHGDPEPISAEWFETTRGRGVRRSWTATAGAAEPSPSPSASAEALVSCSQPPRPTPSPVDEPGRAVDLVVMRGRFDSAPPGGPPPPDAPERWIVVAYDSAHPRALAPAVLDEPPALPDDAASFELK